MGHFELWYPQNKVAISEPTVSNIPDFFDPFTCKNLKPVTIVGFAAAIADHLPFCLFVQELSKSLDLYRPIASVYREKPTANTGVASRDLPLLLLVFTKDSLLTFKGGQSVKKKKKKKQV